MRTYVLIITLHADPAMPAGYEDWGGTHAYMREMLEMFTKRHINAILITRQSVCGLAQYEEYSSFCQIYRLLNGNHPQTDKHTLLHYHQENLESIVKIIESRDSLPICIHSVYWNSGRIAMELSNRFRIPFVHSVISNSLGRNQRGAKPDIPERSIYEKQIYDSAKYILCVSDDEKKDIVSLYNINSKKIIVAGQAIGSAFLFPMHDINGFPLIGFPNHFHNKIIPPSQQFLESRDDFWTKKAFTYFGRIAIDKGIDIIIKAWCKLYEKYGEECPPLWIVGGSIAEIENIRNKVKPYISNLVKAENTRKLIWWGYLNSNGVSTILLKTIVLLAHSKYEPGGRVILEAMVEGIPAIATANGFAKDVIRNWYNGFIVTYGNVNDLIRKMDYFIRQPHLTDSLGENARKDAMSYYENLHFEEHHLYAYGLLPNSPHTEIWTPHMSSLNINMTLNTHSYTVTSLSEQYIKSFIKKETNNYTNRDNDVNITSSSFVCKFLSEKTNYYTKQFVTRLSTNAIYNPVLQNEKLRHARDRFLREKNIFTMLKHPYYISSDDENLMILLKEIPHVSLPYSEYLSLCISHLANNYDYLSVYEKQAAVSLFSSRLDSIYDIETNIKKLRETFPNMYFECTGFFSPMICWKVLKEMLDFNIDSFTHEKKDFYSSYIEKFYNTNYIFHEYDFCYVNIDAAPRHLIYDGKTIIPIDFERMSIGIREVSIASFLYSIILKSYEKNAIKDLWRNLNNSHSLSGLDEPLLISLIICRMCYDMMRLDLMNIEDVYNLKCKLKQLMRMWELTP